MRLTVVIDANPDAVARVVARHGGLVNLVANEWIILLCLDGGSARRFDRDLRWQVWRQALARP